MDKPSKIEANIAVIKLDTQPAKATQIAPNFSGFNLEKLTGTGLAQPNLRIINDANPKGSICFNGFSDNLPSFFAVVSPK